MAMALPRGPLTVDDLADLPDDGHRYELMDGTLLVTPAPGTAHQLAVGRLYLVLGNGLAGGLGDSAERGVSNDALAGAARSPGVRTQKWSPRGLYGAYRAQYFSAFHAGDFLLGHLVAMLAPYDYVISPGTVLEPDLLVVRAEQLAGEKLTTTPLLVVEVLSPSTRRTDLGSKRLAYQDAGVPAYWILDPVVPALTVHRLDADGVYQTTIVAPPAVWAEPDLGVTIDPRHLCAPAH